MSSVENKPKISFVIPAYNVETYIHNCIDSILKQTFKSIEIIVVDDGSTDKTGEIIDDLKKSDSRVIPVHKFNEGVSVARNIGIDIAKGEYIVFVDGDDYLSSDFATYMLKLIDSNKGDFAFSKKCFTASGEHQTKYEKIEIVSSEEATGLLLSPEVIVGCWNKIYRLEFVKENKLRFSTKLFYGEGLSFITAAAQKADKIIIGNRKVYFYRRNNEMSATSNFDIDKMRNGEKALNNIYKNIKNKNQYVEDMFLLHKTMFYVGAVTKLKSQGLRKDDYRDYIRWENFIRNNCWKLFLNKRVSLYRKGVFIAASISPNLLAIMDKYRRKRISANSV